MSVPVFCSFIRRKDMDTVLNCLVTDSVGPGEYLDRFQKLGREVLGYEQALAFRSPHTAIGAALDALAVGPGDTVALPALAPAYCVELLAARGIHPLFVDSRAESPVIGAETFKAASDGSERKPKALLLSDVAGLLPDPEAIEGLGIPVIEDMSQAIGAYRGESRAGSFGNLAVIGLENGGLVTAGGGALLASFGRREATVLRNLAEGIPRELRMTDYNAALGLAQLKDLEASIGKRRELYRVFSQSLARTRHRLLSQEGEGEPGYWALPVALESGIKDVRAYAKKKDVETEPAFEDTAAGRGLVPEGSCPNARSLVPRTLLFPLHHRIGTADAQRMTKVLATLP